MKKKTKIKYEAIIGILLLIVITSLTIGYARYSTIIALHGTGTFRHNGTVRISSITAVDSQNLNNETHTIDGMDVSFSVQFNNQGQGAGYYITYEITVVNESFYEYEFTPASYVPSVSAGSSTVNTSYELSGLAAGEKLAPNASKTFRLTIHAEISADHQGAININGEAEGNMEQEEIGTIMGSFSGSSSGDLDNNDLASFTVSVINSYDYAIVFNFMLGSSQNFSIVDCNTGNALADMTIPHNSTNSYTFCVKKNNGVDFATSPQSLAVYLVGQNLPNYFIGNLTLAVPVTIVVTDDDAPIISGASITKTFGNKGNAVLSWTGTDDHNISAYYVEVHKGNETPTIIQVPVTDNPSYTFTDIAENTDYYFVIYGKDEFQNCVLGDDCGEEIVTNPSTSGSGVAVRVPTSGKVSYNWTYSVTFDLTNASSNSATSVLEGKDYTCSIDANFACTLPSANNLPADTVKMGGQNVRRCNSQNNCNGYYYNNGNITVYNVTGNLEINLSATSILQCLTKGTKVSLANGKYKNIENVDYDDLLSVWDYKAGKLTYEYPIWIEQEKETDHYQKTTLSDGTVLKTVGGHAVYDLDKKMFVDVSKPEEFGEGSKIAKIENGKVKPVTVKSIETVNKKTTYYHVVSTTYYNIIANDVLTTDDATILSNLYGFTDNITWPSTRDNIINNNN